MKKVYTFPHTHWDFEWYFSYNESTIQLIYHMDDVIRELNSGKLNTYLLDGQLSILEDYLKYVPEKKNEVEKLIKEGKLIIGPWYTQTDELIISGESIVRNLFYGMKTAREWGEPMPVGYLPDSFGQSKDMPKILNGFNIKNSVFWRGVAKEQVEAREFVWKAEDDSEVLVYNIKNGYFYGGEAMMVSDDIELVESTINKSTKDLILFPIGADQRKVDLNYKERLEFYNKNTKNEFVYQDSTIEKFFEDLKEIKDELNIVEGEFISPSDSKIHHSIYSSRYDHKYLNDKIERRLINILEPLMVMAQNMGMEPKLKMLEEIWKVFMRNHAHDSACGCNTDKTNKIILSRLEEVDQLSYSAMDYILRKLSVSMTGVKENDLFIFNTLPIAKTTSIEVKISTRKRGFIIYDEEKKEVKFDLVNCEKVYGGIINKYEKDNKEEEYYYVSTVRVEVKIDALKIYKLEVCELDEFKDVKPKKLKAKANTSIEDKFYKIDYIDGKLNLIDKERNVSILDFIKIENSGDDGDTYDYSPPEFDRVLNYDFANSVVSVEKGKLFESLIISGQWLFPQNLEERTKGICSKITGYKFIIKLVNNKVIDCKLTLDNECSDYRLRVIVKTDIESEKSISNTQFGIVERENTPAHMNDWKEIGWKEEPTPIYPMINYTGLRNNIGTCIVMSKGIKEYEVLEDKDISLTLFRCVGYLGKPDLIRRPGAASGNQFKYIETPDSQLYKQLKFKFGIYFNNNFNAVDAYNTWLDYAIWTPYYNVEEMNLFTNTLKYFKVNELEEKMKIENIVDISKIEDVVITAMIPIDEESYIIRFLNPTENLSNGGMIKAFNSKEYEFVNLLGESIGDVKINNGYIDLEEFKKGEIKSIKVVIK